MSALGSLVVKLALDHAEYTKGLDRNSQASLKFARNTQRTFDRAADNVKSFATRSIAQVGAFVGALVGAGASLNTALEFDRSLAEVSTLLDGTADSTRELGFEAERLARQFGTLPIDQTKAFYQVISAGASDAAEATDILTVANQLAVGGVTEVLAAVDGLTSILNAYGDQVESATAVSDTLFVGMRSGKTTIGELSGSLGKVAPIAASLNVSFDELVATIAALTKGGISTAESITGVRAILAAIAKPTKEASNLSEGLGIQFNSAGLKAKGFAGFLDEIVTKTGGSTDKLAQLFGGVEALVPVMALAGNAGNDFNDIMSLMGEKAGSTEEAFNKMADSRGFKIDKLMASINSIALTLGSTLADVLAPAAAFAAEKLNNMFGSQRELTAIEKQKDLVGELEKELASLNNQKNIPIYGDLFFDKRQHDLVSQRLDDARGDLAGLEKQFEETAKAAEKLDKPVETIIKTGDRASKSVSTLTKAIDTEDSVMQELEREVKRLTLAYDPLIKRNEELAKVILLRDAGLRPDIADQEFARIINEYQSALDEVPETINEITDGLTVINDRTVEVFGSSEQLIIQGVRNIQTSLANGLFNFFDDGLDGMVRGVKSAVGRIIAEFASIKLLQAAGIGALFGFGSSSALAAGGAAGAGGFGSGLLNLIGSGFGASNLFGSFATSGIGQSLGLSVTGPVANFGQLTGLGAGLSSALGTLSAGALGFGIGSAIAGDKKVFGINGSITSAVGAGLGAAFGGPVGAAIGGVIGGGINALFGRGPLKQRRTELDAIIGAGGIESGSLQTNFRAKGGLFRSNKNDFAAVDLVTGQISTDNDKLNDFADNLAKISTGIVGQINATVGSITGDLRLIGDALDISTGQLDSYRKNIELISEKGEFLTDQQIADEIALISDELTRSLIPSIDQLGRVGETTFQTAQRLGSEFSSLENILRLIGQSSDDARELLRGFSIEQRTAFVDAAGGVDVLNQKAQFFFDNVLTDGQRLDVLRDQLSGALQEFGINFIPSLEQFNAAMTSGDLPAELFQAGLNVQGLVVEIDRLTQSSNNAADAVSDLSGLNDAFSVLQKSVDAERARITDEYNDALAISNQRIADVTAEISSLDALTKSLSSSVSSLQPLSRNQALQQIDDAIAAARQGIFPEVEDIKDALSVLTGSQSTSGFRTEFDLLSSQSQAAQKIDELNGIAVDELLLQQRSLSALEAQRTRLDDGFRKQSAQLDDILAQAKLQVNALSGLDDAILALTDALSQFNISALLARTGSGVGPGILSSRRVSIPLGRGVTLAGSANDLARQAATSIFPFQNPQDSDAVSAQLARMNETLIQINKQASSTANTLDAVTNGNTALKTKT